MATRIQAVWRRHSAKRVVQAFRLQASLQNQASGATIIQASPKSSSSPSSYIHPSIQPLHLLTGTKNLISINRRMRGACSSGGA